MNSMPRLMIAAPNSHAGKTTVTCAMLQALKLKNKKAVCFKCGPDYIDPMFHKRVLGTDGCNLDLYFTPEAVVKQLFCHYAQGADLALIEGVMGYYDGLGGTSCEASSYHLAKATQTPVLLVVNAKGASLSLAAMLNGFLQFYPNSQIAAVLLNHCSEGLYHMLKPMIEERTGLKVLGYLPYMPECSIPSRHLGLVNAQEIANLRAIIDKLAHALLQTVDWQTLFSIMEEAPPLQALPLCESPVVHNRPVIAVARDEAFCFYYRENLDLLASLGAQIAEFSPLHDECLPHNADALYLGGGYPELHAKALGENAAMRQSILRAVQAGLPTFAECGGFLYLQQSLRDVEGTWHPMVGALSGKSQKAQTRTRFGYIALCAQKDTLLCQKGKTVRGHEFHYWDSDCCGQDMLAAKPVGKRQWECCQTGKTYFAGFAHLYLYSNISFARSFVQAAGKHKEGRICS